MLNRTLLFSESGASSAGRPCSGSQHRRHRKSAVRRQGLAPCARQTISRPDVHCETLRIREQQGSIQHHTPLISAKDERARPMPRILRVRTPRHHRGAARSLACAVRARASSARTIPHPDHLPALRSAAPLRSRLGLSPYNTEISCEAPFKWKTAHIGTLPASVRFVQLHLVVRRRRSPPMAIRIGLLHGMERHILSQDPQQPIHATAHDHLARGRPVKRRRSAQTAPGLLPLSPASMMTRANSIVAAQAGHASATRVKPLPVSRRSVESDGRT